MATTFRSNAVPDAPVTFVVPDLGGTAINAPATAQAIANYNAIVARLAEADAALKAAEIDVRAANDDFLHASAVALRRRAEPPSRQAIERAEQRVRNGRQYRELVRRALGDAAAELVAALRAERGGALDALDRELAETRRIETEAIEHVANLRAQRAGLHAIRRWIADFPGSADHVTQYRAATAAKLLDLTPNGEPVDADTVLNALRADAAR